MRDSCTKLRARLNQQRDGIDFEATGKNSTASGVLAVGQSPGGHSTSDQERDLISAAALAIVAGYFLPEQIEIEWQSVAAASPEYSGLLQILYDVRAYCSKSSPLSPALHLSGNTNATDPKERSSTNSSVAPDADCLTLFSGGIDSTAALTILLKQRQKPVALFLGANFDTEALEWSAARNIAEVLDIELLRWDWHVQGLPIRGADPVAWPQFGQFPYYNSIPHGRDILSAVMAASLARKRNIPRLAFGQEKESRDKIIRYKGRDIYRHDVESREGAKLLQAWLNRNLINAPAIFSPIEDMTIADIRRYMIQDHPHLLSMTQSCFWEHLCGRCIKCVSLYLAQREAGRSPVLFPHNPLSDRENNDLANIVLSSLPDNEVGYGTQIRTAISSLIQSKEYTAEDYWIHRAMEQDRFRLGQL